MTVQQYYNYLTSQMTAEEALMKLLQTHIEHWEYLMDKYNEQGEDVGGSPIMIIAACCQELGWDMKVKDEEYVHGIITGNKEFMQRAMVLDQQ